MSIIVRDDVGVFVMENLFPDYVPPKAKSTVRPSRKTLNSLATRAIERQATVAGDNTIIPLVYGRQRVGAKIAVVKEDSGFFYVLAVWCLGEINQIESILIDGAVDATTDVADYVGTTTQTADTTLASIISGYADDLVINKDGTDIGIAYSVLKFPADNFPNRIEAIIQGKLVYDYRTSTTVYSTNPAICMADFITNDVYGYGRSVDTASVQSVANDNDVIITGAIKAREINISIDKVAEAKTHLEALRAYAGCFVVQDGSNIKLISDKVTATSNTFNNSDIVADSLTINKSGIKKIPNVVKIIYTDTTSEPWKDAEAVAEAVSFTERRESIVKLPGITEYNQAYREAVERLDALNLSDLTVKFLVFDEGLVIQVGDVIEVTHFKGLTAKKIRVLDVVDSIPGRFLIYGAEYDPAVYNSSIDTTPTYNDTSIPSPTDPVPPSSVLVSEELFQQATGSYASRLRISWTAPNYPFIEHYRVCVKSNNKIVYENNTTDLEIPTGAIVDTTTNGVILQHDIEVYTYSGLAYSSAATNVITPLGKQLPPSDIATLQGFEAGGEVFLNWTDSVDIDFWRYEIRYGATSDTWDDATLLDQTDTLRWSSKEIPVGTWKFFAKGLDSVGNYSTNAATVNITVTLDTDAFLVDQYEFINPGTETALHEYYLDRTSDSVYRVTENSTETVDDLFATGAANTYTNNINSYQTSLVSEYVSETFDLGVDVSGDWLATVDSTTISGSVVSQLEVSDDNFVADTQVYTALSAKTVGRYGRIRVKSDTGVFHLAQPDVHLNVNVIPRSENTPPGTVDTSFTTSGKPYTVTLQNTYVSAKAITITPLGTAARSYALDNVLYGNTQITNGNFDTNVNNWTNNPINSTLVWNSGGDGGRALLTSVGAAYAEMYQFISLPAGDYHAWCEFERGTSSTAWLRVGTIPGGTNKLNVTSSAASGILSGTFNLTDANEIYVYHYCSNVDGHTCYYDSTTIRPANLETANGNRVRNATFDTVVDDWTAFLNSTLSHDATNNRLKITNGTSGTNGGAYQKLGLPAGEYEYSFTYDDGGSTALNTFKLGNSIGSGEHVNIQKTDANGTVTGTFTLTSYGTYYVSMQIDNTNSTWGYFDNLEIKSTDGQNNFDVYIFDSAGTQTATDFYWKFEGV